jgi:glutaredoxin
MSEIPVKEVAGEDKGDIMLYALSTCHWCKKTKALLGDLGVAYKYMDIDGLVGEERETAKDEVMKWNPKCSFPTIVIKGECIVGFDEEKIRGLLE